MKKIAILALYCALGTTNLFCAQAGAAAALCTAAQSAAVEHFSYKVKPSNQVTQEEADAHEALIDAVFKRDTTEKDFRKRNNIHLAVPQTFLYELQKKRDLVVSAYDIRAPKQVLVGGLLGTKHRDSHEDDLGFVDVFMQINAIYVADGAQRQGIGTQMVKLFQEYTKNLSLALYVKTTNITGQMFWDSQAEFQQATGENAQIGWNLLTMEYPRTPIRQDAIVTYYSENGSMELLYDGKSVFEDKEEKGS